MATKNKKVNKVNPPKVEKVSSEAVKPVEQDFETKFEAKVEEVATTVETKGTEVAAEVKNKFASTFSILKWTWAFILIFGGLLLLLNNFEKIPSSAFSEIVSMAFKLWPLLLVLAGVQIIFDKNRWSKIGVTILVFMLLTMVVFISLFNSGVSMFKWVGDVVPNALIQFSKSEYATERYLYESTELEKDISRLELDYKFAVANFDITATNEKDLSGEYARVEGKNFKELGKPNVKESQSSNIQRFEFDNSNRQFKTFFQSREGETYNAAFTPATRTSVNVDVNAAEGKINIPFGLYRDLDVALNVGDVEVKLDNDVEVDYSKMSVNVGQLQVDVADADLRNLDLRVNVGSSLLYIDLDEYTINMDYNVNVGSLKAFGKTYNGRGQTKLGNGDKTIDLTIRVDVGDVEISEKKN